MIALVDTDSIIILIGIVTLVVAFITEIYARKTYENLKSPKIVVEVPFSNSLEIRNIGTDIAKNIKERTDLFRDVPTELWNFTGPIDYMKVKSPGTVRMLNFHDKKMIQPSNSANVCFEYENSDGNRFYSEIKIQRREPTQQIYFDAPILVKWGRL